MDNDAQLEVFQQTLISECESFGVQLDTDAVSRLTSYYRLLNKWNPRLHLVAPCSPSEFAIRHVLESLLLSNYLTPGSMTVDIGSGAGFPIIPNLVVRRDIKAVLIESSQKKAVFLREALIATDTAAQGEVIAERFERVATPTADFITCRALDRFQELSSQIVAWSPRPVTLLFFGGEGLEKRLAEQKLNYSPVRIPETDNRYLFVVRLE